MCALTPPLFSANLGWPLLDNPIPLDPYPYHSYRVEAEICNSFEPLFHYPPSQLHQVAELDRCASFTGNDNINYNDKDDNTNDGGNRIKKLSHNASERDRRKKLNVLYSSLRFLLPAAEQTKKLSIPATVSRVLKYIPALQKEVESLYQVKEDVLKRISRQASRESGHQEKQREKVGRSSLIPGIIVTQLSDREIAIQISTIHKSPLSDILDCLEDYGLRLISVSSSVSSYSRVFYNLHLEMEKSSQVKCEELSEKLLSLHDKKNELLP